MDLQKSGNMMQPREGTARRRRGVGLAGDTLERGESADSDLDPLADAPKGRRCLEQRRSIKAGRREDRSSGNGCEGDFLGVGLGHRRTFTSQRGREEAGWHPTAGYKTSQICLKSSETSVKQLLRRVLKRRVG